MGRWPRENDFNDSVSNAVKAAPFPGLTEAQAFAAMKGVIATESGFNPNAMRGEPQIGDASIGLMQLLLKTARGEGFTGTAAELMDPAINLWIGARLLRRLLVQTGGDLDAAFSAYNGGYRPELGFGKRRTPATPVVCIQWKPNAPATGRTIAEHCEVTGSTKIGEFSNQKYVDKAHYNYAYFFASAPAAGPAPK